MGIDMRGFKVVYKERVYNALNMDWRWGDTSPEVEAEEKGIAKPKFLTVVTLNEDGEVIMLHDESCMFQFLRITN
ncbi:hypothetical protein C808_00620 [Lachnospiraceae bacterium M18-1]|nr:hypothetical protein C808_00620 [Lachnospiraceae bacterium M18-1]